MQFPTEIVDAGYYLVKTEDKANFNLTAFICLLARSSITLR